MEKSPNDSLPASRVNSPHRFFRFASLKLEPFTGSLVFPSDSDADSFTHSIVHLKRRFFPLFVMERIERARLDVVKFGMELPQYLHGGNLPLVDSLCSLWFDVLVD